jgi:hypothetical protein
MWQSQRRRAPVPAARRVPDGACSIARCLADLTAELGGEPDRGRFLEHLLGVGRKALKARRRCVRTSGNDPCICDGEEPHLRRDWAHPCRICTGTGLNCATSAPGRLIPANLHRDWAHPCHICARTGLAPATSAPGVTEARQPGGAGARGERGGGAAGADLLVPPLHGAVALEQVNGRAVLVGEHLCGFRRRAGG